MGANKVEITGRLVKIADSSVKGYEKAVTVYIPRKNGKSENDRNDNSGIYPKVYCPAGVIDESVVDNHEMVHIEGYVESYKKGKFSQQRIVATSVSREKTVVENEFGVTGIYFEEPHSKIYLSGEVKNVPKNPKNGWLFVDIETDKGVIRTNISKPSRTKISVGDTAYVCGKLYTVNKRAQDGKDHHFENIIIDDIGVVPVVK